MTVSGTPAARQADVLRAIVHDYIRTGEPVGSGRVARRYRLGVSSATIRNHMSLLEEEGYLIQPHTSAGRIPTDRGYRFYVDALPRRRVLSEAHRRAIAASLEGPPPDVEGSLRLAAAVLSRLTHLTAVMLPPVLRRSRVVRGELVPLGPRALLLVVSDTGRVDQQHVELPEDAGRAAVRRVSVALEEAAAGRTFEDAVTHTHRLAERSRDPDRAVLRAVADRLAALDRGPEHVILGGAGNIAGEDAFERRETVQRLFEALEQEAAVHRFLRRLGELEGVRVAIGSENPLAAMREASVVVASYRAGGRPVGTVAVIGPTRMEYPRAISTVEAVARRLSGLMGILAG